MVILMSDAFKFDQTHEYRKQNASNREDLESGKINPVWRYECSDKKSSVHKRNGYSPHGTHHFPTRQIELPGVR